ncbi:MAG: PHP domain-containing protein [Rhodothermales bacterium]|nr:PHP domain-containing protein [Rhodothermales bacterium]
MTARVRIEMHAHTTVSDGKLDPGELVALAAEKQLTGLVITDHDTTEAYTEELRQAAESKGVTLIGGIEASGRTPHDDVHLLGIGVDPRHPALNALTETVKSARLERGREIVGKLQRLGVKLDWEKVEESAGTVMTRPHVAQALMSGGHVSDMREAFDRYLARGADAHVPLRAISASQWMEAIHKAGGLAFLAHPGDWTAHRTIRHLLEIGLDGLEVWHPSHDSTLVEYYRNLADRFGLLTAGGSDFHGRSEAEFDRFGTMGPLAERWTQIQKRLGH